MVSSIVKKPGDTKNAPIRMIAENAHISFGMGTLLSDVEEVCRRFTLFAARPYVPHLFIHEFAEIGNRRSGARGSGQVYRSSSRVEVGHRQAPILRLGSFMITPTCSEGPVPCFYNLGLQGSY